MAKKRDYVKPVPMVKLNKLRCEHRLSTRELAALSGVSPTTISNYENGKFVPQEAKLAKIAAALGCDVADIKEE